MWLLTRSESRLASCQMTFNRGRCRSKFLVPTYSGLPWNGLSILVYCACTSWVALENLVARVNSGSNHCGCFYNSAQTWNIHSFNCLRIKPFQESNFKARIYKKIRMYCFCFISLVDCTTSYKWCIFLNISVHVNFAISFYLILSAILLQCMVAVLASVPMSAFNFILCLVESASVWFVQTRSPCPENLASQDLATWAPSRGNICSSVTCVATLLKTALTCRGTREYTRASAHTSAAIVARASFRRATWMHMFAFTLARDPFSATSVPGTLHGRWTLSATWKLIKAGTVFLTAELPIPDDVPEDGEERFARWWELWWKRLKKHVYDVHLILWLELVA